MLERCAKKNHIKGKNKVKEVDQSEDGGELIGWRSRSGSSKKHKNQRLQTRKKVYMDGRLEGKREKGTDGEPRNLNLT